MPVKLSQSYSLRGDLAPGDLLRYAFGDNSLTSLLAIVF